MNNIFKKTTLVVFGLLCLLLAGIAAVTPGLPAFPFILLALWAFARSSQKVHAWLLKQTIVISILHQAHQFRQHKAISLQTKLMALGCAWGLFAAVLIIWKAHLTTQAIGFGLAAVLCTLLMLVIPTLRE